MAGLTKKERILNLEKQNKDFERRLGILEDIIKPPVLVEMVSVKELDREVFTGLDSEWCWATVDRNLSVWVWKGKPQLDELNGYWHSLLEEGKKLNRKDYKPVDWKQAILYRKAELELGNELCEKLLETQSGVMCKCSMNRQIERSHAYGKIVSVNEEGFHTSTGKVWKYVIPVDNQGNNL